MSTDDIARLETAVLSGWQNTHDAHRELQSEWLASLHVYADALMKAGEPRGELIALDARGPEYDARRQELLSEWVGAPLVETTRARARHGLLEVSLTDTDEASLDELFASEASRYISHVNIVGGRRFLRTFVDALASTTRAWLRNLCITATGAFDVSDPALDDACIAKLTAAAPKLHTAELRGHAVAETLPQVQRLVLSGHDAIVPAHLPTTYRTLTELDLAIAAPGDIPAGPFEEFLIFRSGVLPALRRLRLDRNELGHTWPRRLGGTRVTVEQLLRSIPMPERARVTHVWLPSARRQNDLDALQHILDTMPNLQEATISNEHGFTTELRHETARVRFAKSTLPPE
jgi:hypothetical protein